MKRATTPTHIFTLPTNASDFIDIHITYQQRGVNVLELDKTDLTISGKTVSYTLTQEQSNLFSNGQAYVQVRVRNTFDQVLASEIITFNVGEVLCDDVLPIQEEANNEI